MPKRLRLAEVDDHNNKIAQMQREHIEKSLAKMRENDEKRMAAEGVQDARKALGGVDPSASGTAQTSASSSRCDNGDAMQVEAKAFSIGRKAMKNKHKKKMRKTKLAKRGKGQVSTLVGFKS